VDTKERRRRGEKERKKGGNERKKNDKYVREYR
jgi:hypothetical protein